MILLRKDDPDEDDPDDEEGEPETPEPEKDDEIFWDERVQKWAA